MPDHTQIYNAQAVKYEQMVACEDYEQHLLPALNAIHPLTGLDVVESGAGTGRLTALLAPHARSIHAFDLSPHMLTVAQAKLRNAPHVTFAAADHRALPVPDRSADLLISGWSVSMLIINQQHTWETPITHTLNEFERVLRPDGTLIIIETQGTGAETPQGHPRLNPYYAYLEAHGFTPTWIRTDYQFADEATSHELMRFFFGDEAAQRWVTQYGRIIPECTGIWWRTKREQ